MKRFEYRVLIVEENDIGEDLEHELNDLGAEGFELAGFVVPWFFLKRETGPSADAPPPPPPPAGENPGKVSS